MGEGVSVSIKLFEKEMTENARLRTELKQARAENERLKQRIKYAAQACEEAVKAIGAGEGTKVLTNLDSALALLEEEDD